MVQISTPGVTPNRGMGPVRRFLSNYFDVLLILLFLATPMVIAVYCFHSKTCFRPPFLKITTDSNTICQTSSVSQNTLERICDADRRRGGSRPNENVSVFVCYR